MMVLRNWFLWPPGIFQFSRFRSQYRDRGGHFKVVGLKTLANIKKHSGRCFAIYLTFARHLIYHLNKYNKNVHTCYTIQYSQYVK